MSRLQIRAVAFAAFWRVCTRLGDTDGQAFAFWVANPGARGRYRRAAALGVLLP